MSITQDFMGMGKNTEESSSQQPTLVPHVCSKHNIMGKEQGKRERGMQTMPTYTLQHRNTSWIVLNPQPL